MDFEPEIKILKKIRLNQLEPSLAREIIEFAESIGYETTVTSKTSLDFLFRIYQAEKVKEKRSLKKLKKAENLIIKLSSLHFEEISKREDSRRREERKRKITPAEGLVSITTSKKIKELFSSIGIEDEKTAEQAVVLFGETKVEGRVDLVKASLLGDDLIKKVFREHPETILIPKEDDFMAEIDAMETKKGVIDTWIHTNMKMPPIWANYNETPGILLDSYADINRLLTLEVPAEPPQITKKEEIKFRGKPMDPGDFIKVVSTLGFSPIRETKHGTLMKNESGGIMCVQKGHRKQEELNPSTIKKKLIEAGVDLDEFERKRRGLSL